MKFNKMFLLLLAGILALSLAACGDKDKVADKEQDGAADGAGQVDLEELQAKLDEQRVEKDLIVALVNEEEIQGEDYNAALSSVQGQMQQMGMDPTSEESAEQIKTQTLDLIINQTLILQQAKKEGIEVDAEEIDSEYGYFIEQFGDEETMIATLENEGITVEALKKQIEDSIMFQKYQEEITSVEESTEEEVEEYYEILAGQTEGAPEDFPEMEEIREEIQMIIEQNKQQEQLAAHVEELKKGAIIERKI